MNTKTIVKVELIEEGGGISRFKPLNDKARTFELLTGNQAITQDTLIHIDSLEMRIDVKYGDDIFEDFMAQEPLNFMNSYIGV